MPSSTISFSGVARVSVSASRSAAWLCAPGLERVLALAPRSNRQLLACRLIGFPADVPVKVVSTKLDAAAQESLLEDLRKLCEACYIESGLYASTEFEVTQRMGGAIASIAFTVRVPSSDALTVLRTEIKGDKRVKMVF